MLQRITVLQLLLCISNQGGSPGWCGSLDWVPACKPKGHWFNSQSGHMPGLWARLPGAGHKGEKRENCYSIINKVYFFKILFIYFQTKGKREREKGKERNINVRLLLTLPPPGAWPTTQACALTENGTSDPLVRRPVLNPLNYTSQDPIKYMLKKNHFIFYFDNRWQESKRRVTQETAAVLQVRDSGGGQGQVQAGNEVSTYIHMRWYTGF